MGANSAAWSRTMRDRLGLDLPAPVIERTIVDGVVARFRSDGVPHIPGAVDAVRRIAATARYDSAIARWFAEMLDDFPPVIMGAYEKVIDLAYGENPHQRAAYYQQVGARMHVLSMVRQLGGKRAVVQQRARPQRGAPAGAASSSSRPARSSSTTTRAAAPPPARRSRPTSARSRATRCRRSAA